ncbi:catalase family protein [Ruegeria pomeroyi]|uniref:catalase family protein n=1 Tax=Ruegeria pomeroyi TaxID=89184 RepID=UPI001F4690DD|nr:catalase family protein [Ruegeria pomeroyi]MCE8507966.1 catalase family protein [Ruegeria pomeroyi]
MTDIRADLGEAPISANEDEIIADIIQANLKMMEVEENGFKWRAQHPKGHGAIPARFIVGDDVPQAHRTGLFAQPGSYDALIRFSNGTERRDDPKGGDAHGMAIKLFGVPGARVEGEADAKGTLDFVLVDNETFFEGDLNEYSAFNDLVSEVLNFKRNGDEALAAIVNGIYLKFLKKYFSHDIYAVAQKFGDQHPTSPLRAIYWSTTPFLHGDIAVKHRVVPDPAPAPGELRDGVEGADGLTEQLLDGLSGKAAAFDFYIQPQEDVAAHPIEDPNVNWTENGAGWVKLARIEIPALDPGDAAARAARVAAGDRMAFNPWNTLPEHRPLGAVNRVRNKVYKELARARNADGV